LFLLTRSQLCIAQKRKAGHEARLQVHTSSDKDGLKASKGGYSLHQLSVTAALAILVIGAALSNWVSRMLAMQAAHV
jgi:hypothetical protein